MPRDLGSIVISGLAGLLASTEEPKPAAVLTADRCCSAGAVALFVVACDKLATGAAAAAV